MGEAELGLKFSPIPCNALFPLIKAPVSNDNTSIEPFGISEPDGKMLSDVGLAIWAILIGYGVDGGSEDLWPSN